MRRGIVLVCAVVLFSAFLGTLVYSEYARSRVVNPLKTGETYASLIKHHPISSVRKFSYSRQTYTVVIGNVDNVLLSLPSGPPAYVFNQDGTLVDWSSDTGDDKAFSARWGGFKDAIDLGKEGMSNYVR